MMNAKVLGFAGFVTSFGVVAALAGCGGDDAPTPTLAMTSANATEVAGHVLIDSSEATNIDIPSPDLALGSKAFAPLAKLGLRQALSRAPLRQIAIGDLANATQTTQCTGGGTLTFDGTAVTATTTNASETITYKACIEGTTTIDGSIKVSASTNGNTASLSLTVSLSVTADQVKLVEAGDLTVSFDTKDISSGHVSSNQLSVSVTSPQVTDKVTLSHLDITSTTDANGDSSASESFAIETQKLGGLVAVDTETAVAQSALAAHPHAGQVTVTGGNNSKLVITILGDESFTPPAGQGQVKIELDSGDGKLAAAVYASWADLEAAAGNVDLGL
jgi:hypothetical protein